ncbi:pantoate--beta-alanine ligase [Aeoliella sp.]|uniref:pantoate--beta-alanine ligase n=1 Tax=Aeoliella sp. TaxID=2795800 RepID=UPI003CCC2D79
MKTVTSPTIVRTGEDIRQVVHDAQRVGRRVGVVPTMGALHQGHLSLVDAAREHCDLVVVTVFVNPTQFAPHEDYQRYPRELDSDAAKLAQHGCDYVFAPSVEEMYPDGFETSIDVGSVALPYEGERRPTHFAGVATVVLKLLSLVPADAAFFGQKDYQQTLVVGQMIRDLNVPTDLVVCPTVRESDGLAMSSRNAYLDEDQRQRATALSASMQLAGRMVDRGERDVATLRRAMESHLAEVGGVDVDYIAFVRAGTVEAVETIAGETMVLIAARVGQTRLIDNMQIG